MLLSYDTVEYLRQRHKTGETAKVVYNKKLEKVDPFSLPLKL
jgi:hypothetical protein